MSTLCECGSGLERQPLIDAAGIFCCYVCDSCETEKKNGYNPNIFSEGTAYSKTGEEVDILLEEYKLMDTDEEEADFLDRMLSKYGITSNFPRQDELILEIMDLLAQARSEGAADVGSESPSPGTPDVPQQEGV